MSVNRGKQFETVIKDCFSKVPGTLVVRLHDQTNGFAGSKNPCDFIIYHKPYLYTIECKSVSGNTLPFSNISQNQWQELLKMSEVPNVISGVICWWVDRDTTMFIDIRLLQELKERGYKSIDYCASFALEDIDNLGEMWTWIIGKKKRVFFEYDIESFLRFTGGYEWAK